MAREVTTIPSTIDFFTKTPLMSTKKKRVAAYARVSTDNPEQLTSFETQKTYFKKYIEENPDWEIVSIYADEGISGTTAKKRKSFQSMIAKVRRGEIDIVLAKSVSRFGRNVVDIMSIVKEFRALGADIFFEEENIHSIDPASDFVLSIHASIAQEESRHISDNIKWSLRKNFADGKVTIPFSSFLGLKRGPDGEIMVDEEEAKVVKYIYMLFLTRGMTPEGIAKQLTKEGIINARKECFWTYNSVKSILTNEKYKGEAILQKGFVADYLEHKTVPNNGELPKYHVKNSHEAIIDTATWDMVQLEIKRRKDLGRSYSAVDEFASRLICGDCGGIYGKKIWHSNNQYANSVFRCNRKFERGCNTPVLRAEEVKEKFVKAYSLLINNREIISDLEEVIQLLTDTKKEENRLLELGVEMEGIEEANKKLIEEKKTLFDLPEDFAKREEIIHKKFGDISKEIKEVNEAITLKGQKKSKMEFFVKLLTEKKDEPIIWSKELWLLAVESAKVNQDKTITFRFFCGREIRV